MYPVFCQLFLKLCKYWHLFCV